MKPHIRYNPITKKWRPVPGVVCYKQPGDVWRCYVHD